MLNFWKMKIVKKNSAHFWLRIRCDHQKLPQLLRPALNKPDSNLRDFWNFRIFVLTINFRKRMVKTLFFWRKCDKWAVSFEHFYIFEDLLNNQKWTKDKESGTGTWASSVESSFDSGWELRRKISWNIWNLLTRNLY